MNDPESLRDRLLLDEVGKVWRDANWRWFRQALTPPVFQLVDTTTTLGSWRAADRTLSIARAFARTADWARVVEVVHHELAHQYVAEILKVEHETDHGPTFREVLARMGRDGAGDDGVPESPALAKVRKLFALAGSTNSHEAQAAMNAAHRLMLAHNIDLGRTRAASGYAARTIGPARTRHDAWEKLLFGILSTHFFVRVVWVPSIDTATLVQRRGGAAFARRTIAECVGTPANLEIAEWVYTFVGDTGARLWREHRKAHGLTGDRHRRGFLSGLVVGFRQQLDESAARCAQEGLVWVGDPGIDDLVSRRHPRLVRTKVRVAGSEAYHHGKHAGRKLVLHKPIRERGTGGGQLTG